MHQQNFNLRGTAAPPLLYRLSACSAEWADSLCSLLCGWR